MLGANNNQHLSGGVFDGPAHAVKVFVQPVTQNRIGTLGAAGNAWRMTAHTCKDQRHV